MSLLPQYIESWFKSPHFTRLDNPNQISEYNEVGQLNIQHLPPRRETTIQSLIRVLEATSLIKYDTSTLTPLSRPLQKNTKSPIFETEYEDEIFHHFRQLEKRLHLDISKLSKIQPNLDSLLSLRKGLLERVVASHEDLNLSLETLFLCGNYIDRFLSEKKVDSSKFSLLGATCLLLASKFEEGCPPLIEDVLWTFGISHFFEVIVRAERQVLQTLQFELSWPGPISFLRRLQKIDEDDHVASLISEYLLELALIEPSCVGLLPSHVAAATYCCSKLLLQRFNWVSKDLAFFIYHTKIKGLDYNSYTIFRLRV